MNYSQFELLLTAFLPSFILCIYVFIKDRTEKEPIPLLIGLLVSGAAFALPAYYATNAVIKLSNRLFDSYYELNESGIATYVNTGSMVTHTFVTSLFSAIVVVIMIFIPVFLITFRNKNFNCLFDGVVYGTFTAYGFSICFNVMKSSEIGWNYVSGKAFSTIPFFLLVGVYMGLLYTVWHKYSVAAKEEKRLSSLGKINIVKPFRSAKWLALSIAVPIIVYCNFDFSGSVRILNFKYFYFGFIAVTYVIAFIIIHKLSESDATDGDITNALIRKKYNIRETEEKGKNNE